MFRNTFYIGRIFGIPVRIHISWLIFFILLTWSLVFGFGQVHKDWPWQVRWIVGIATSLLFFASVLAHELAHSVLARRRGLKVHDIVLFIFGGVSQVAGESRTPGAEFLIAVVGPLTSVFLGVLFGALGLAMAPIAPPVAAIGHYLGFINLLLAAFNMIPGFPLDGGRVLRSILWKASGDMDRATKWAARAGQGVAYLFIFVGISTVFGYPILPFLADNAIGGLWMAFIGWFLENAAVSSYRQVLLKHSLSAFHVEDVMMHDYPSIAPGVSVGAVVDDYLLPWGFRCLPVVSDGRMVGLVTLHDVNSIPRAEWPSTPAEHVMIPMEEVKITRPDENLWEALVRMTAEEVNQLPVLRDGKLEGLLTRSGVLNFLRARAELGL